MMPTPGAKMSTQVPQFENQARWSMLSDAPTVIAWAVRAGEIEHASAFSLPAARVYVTPDAIDACTAWSTARLAGPARLMFATAGFTACAVTHSMPSMMAE